MSDAAMPHLDRVDELLADRATQGLEPADEQELAALLERHEDVDVLDYDLAAAALDLALDGGKPEPMPDALRRTLEADAAAWLARSRGLSLAGTEAETRAAPERPAHPARSIRPVRWVPWLVAAACLAVAVLSRVPSGGPSEVVEAPSTSPSSLYDRLAALPGTTRVGWAEDDVRGDIVWNNERQEGVMRFRGLATNDPTRLQYQLWIFDAKREEFNAVDGGVFDVDDETGDVYVPVDAKLRVFEPTLFAVTTEPPGGVVKHVDRGDYRIILTAPVEQRGA